MRLDMNEQRVLWQPPEDTFLDRYDVPEWWTILNRYWRKRTRVDREWLQGLEASSSDGHKFIELGMTLRDRHFPLYEYLLQGEVSEERTIIPNRYIAAFRRAFKGEATELWVIKSELKALEKSGEVRRKV